MSASNKPATGAADPANGLAAGTADPADARASNGAGTFSNPAAQQPASAALPILGHGFYWQDLSVGQRFQTLRRTITETDLVNFINVTGMLEAIFIEEGYEHGAIKGRPVPGALTYGLIEGFILQTMIQGTGLAMLELHKKILAPVLVGDTIRAEIEVTALRPTSKNNRAIVTSRIDVLNQHDKRVMTYEATRLLAGRPQA